MSSAGRHWQGGLRKWVPAWLSDLREWGRQLGVSRGLSFLIVSITQPGPLRLSRFAPILNTMK